MKFMVIAALGTILFSGTAHAADLCRAVAIRDIPKTSEYSYSLRKGETVGAVTQYRVDTDTGERTFCSHGGGCYPERVTVAGREQIALKLTNCVIGKQFEPGFYSVDVIRKLNKSADLRFDDIENQLINLGMSSAGADNAARHYVNNPTAACARLVRSALEGNPASRRALSNDPQICNYDYSAKKPVQRRRR